MSSVEKPVSRSVLITIVSLALAGGFFKILGFVLYGSRSLLVDALTSFSNIVALIATTYFYRISYEPPDDEHPYGHYRLGYGGVLTTLTAYGYVAGVSSVELLYSTSYSVELNAVLFAVIGFVIYSIVIYLTLRVGGVFKAYGLFTFSELYESIVTIIATAFGALYSYIIDYVGAIILTTYIFVELINVGKEVFQIISDKSPPINIVNDIYKLFNENGFKIIGLRIRCVVPNIYHGDVKVKPSRETGFDDARRMIDDLKKAVKERYNIDLVVEMA